MVGRPSALTLRLLREVWRHRGQVISIAAVVSVGIMTVLTMRGTYESLESSRARYYSDTRFPDVWAQLERAPESVASALARLSGVASVTTRISLAANLDVPSTDAPALGRLFSLPENRGRELADIHLRRGRYVDPSSPEEAVISDRFAKANGFNPGDTLRAVVNGRLQNLQIVGTAISPEHTYAIPPGSLYPDDERYGIVWMSRRALASIYDMEGAFNEALIALAPGANPEAVLASVDRTLRPFGGLGSYPRERQPSHFMVQSELDGNRATGTAIPMVFLAVAAFLINVVLSRMITTQRSEIAVLKAFGYSNLEVGFHYLQFAMVAVLIGTGLGIGMGSALGQVMVDLYGEFFDFPTLAYNLDPTLILIAVGVSLVAAVVGALGAVRRAVALPPAEAMRAEPPASFRPGIFERIGFGAFLPTAARMILRNVERTPVRTLLSIVGVSFATAILVIGMFMFDGVDRMMDLQFGQTQREDLAVSFILPLSPTVSYDLYRLDGVSRVEGFRSVPVRLRHGHLFQDSGILGLPKDAVLRRITASSGRVQPLPPEGIVMSDLLAERLAVQAGDILTVEVLEGRRPTRSVPVAGIVEDFVGVAVYMDLAALNRLVGDRSLSGAFLTVDDSRQGPLNAKLKRTPAVASVASPTQMLANFQKQLDEGLLISVFFILGFSSVIALAVIYNGARVALSERGRELASLRVLGFSRREVAVLLLGEQAITTLVAIPLGCLLGYGLAAAVSAGIRTDAYRIPFVVSTNTFLLAAGITILAALASGLIVRRRLDRMDLIEVLKTRE